MASADQIQKINKSIDKKNCKDISGNSLDKKIKEALFEPKNGLVYIIQDGIPVLIHERAIQL